METSGGFQKSGETQSKENKHGWAEPLSNSERGQWILLCPKFWEITNFKVRSLCFLFAQAQAKLSEKTIRKTI